MDRQVASSFFEIGGLIVGKKRKNMGSLTVLCPEHKEHSSFSAVVMYQTNKLVLKESELWHHFNKAELTWMSGLI